MNSTFCTPKKVFPSAAASAPTAASFLFVDQQHHHQGSFNGSTTSTLSGSSFRTPGSVKRNGRFHLMPMNINRTPISRLNRVIVNPFEASLNERLHLPMIGSPSLFHRPATPQMSSTQFEWTIEDVASLGPANVEADETQFVMHTDPELEARAQEAITSYFRDNVVLPSPINCPLREASEKTRLLPEVLLDENEDRRDSLEELAAANNKSCLKRIKVRDGFSQTVLTFPPKLPKEVEDMLAGFCTYTQDQQQEESSVESLNDSSNASLRRKLFETSLNSDDLGVTHQEETEQLEQQLQLDREEQRRLLREVLPMGTPELKLAVKTRTRHFGSPTDNHLELSETKKESFGSLSPILSSTGSTPADKAASVTSSAEHRMQGQHSSSTSSLYRSTPERMSSVQRSLSNSVEMASLHGSAMKCLTGQDVNDKDNSEDSLEDSMQVSRWNSSDMTSCNRSLMFTSQQAISDEQMQRTPVRRQNKSASRKNLSRSFSQILNEEFGEETSSSLLAAKPLGSSSQDVIRMLPLIHSELITVGGEDDVFVQRTSQKQKQSDQTSRLFLRTRSDSMYRTDSGFNDEDLTSSSGLRSSGLPSFSTPSTKDAQEVLLMSDDVSMRSFRCD